MTKDSFSAEDFKYLEEDNIKNGLNFENTLHMLKRGE